MKVPTGMAIPTKGLSVIKFGFIYKLYYLIIW